MILIVASAYGRINHTDSWEINGGTFEVKPISQGGDIEKYRAVLSGKEFRIAQLISEGYSRKKIKKILHIDAHYFKIHMQRITIKIKEALTNGTCKTGTQTEEGSDEEVS